MPRQSKPKPANFQELQDFCYKKLEEDGFQDIETSEDHLEYWHSRLFQDQNTPGTFQAKEAYYQLAGQFLHDHTFDSPIEHTVWALHTEGLSNRKIAKKLAATIGRRKVDDLVKKLSRIMLGKLT